MQHTYIFTILSVSLYNVSSFSYPLFIYHRLPLNTVDNKQQFKLSYADPDTLCLLVQAKHTDPTNSGPILLNNDSPGSDFTITPIGRSFDGSQWTSVSGAFSRKLKLRRCNNKKTTCTVVLRKGLDSGGSYFLITTTHSKTDFFVTFPYTDYFRTNQSNDFRMELFKRCSRFRSLG